MYQSSQNGKFLQLVSLKLNNISVKDSQRAY